MQGLCNAPQTQPRFANNPIFAVNAQPSPSIFLHQSYKFYVLEQCSSDAKKALGTDVEAPAENRRCANQAVQPTHQYCGLVQTK